MGLRLREQGRVLRQQQTRRSPHGVPGGSRAGHRRRRGPERGDERASPAASTRCQAGFPHSRWPPWWPRLNTSPLLCSPGVCGQAPSRASVRCGSARAMWQCGTTHTSPPPPLVWRPRKPPRQWRRWRINARRPQQPPHGHGSPND
jgi:hypothetical protein